MLKNWLYLILLVQVKKKKKKKSLTKSKITLVHVGRLLWYFQCLLGHAVCLLRYIVRPSSIFSRQHNLYCAVLRPRGIFGRQYYINDIILRPSALFIRQCFLYYTVLRPIRQYFVYYTVLKPSSIFIRQYFLCIFSSISDGRFCTVVDSKMGPQVFDIAFADESLDTNIGLGVRNARTGR